MTPAERNEAIDSMPTDLIEAVRRVAELAKEATDGPWETAWVEHAGEVHQAITAVEDGGEFVVCDGVGTAEIGDPPYIRDGDNMEFIAHARNLPWDEIVAALEQRK